MFYAFDVRVLDWAMKAYFFISMDCEKTHKEELDALTAVYGSPLSSGASPDDMTPFKS